MSTQSHEDEAALAVTDALTSYTQFCRQYIDGAQTLDVDSLNTVAMHHHTQSQECEARSDHDGARFHHHVALVFAAHGLAAAAASDSADASFREDL